MGMLLSVSDGGGDERWHECGVDLYKVIKMVAMVMVLQEVWILLVLGWVVEMLTVLQEV